MLRRRKAKMDEKEARRAKKAAATLARQNFEHYDAETEFETLAVGNSAAVQARGAAHVLPTLTPNHRGILRILAEYQLENPTSQGMEFSEFLNKCISEMLAHNDLVLRNHLTELTDHRLVETRRSRTGQTLYYIPLPEDVIRKVILTGDSDLP